MKHFHANGTAIPKISPHVETRNCASLRKRRLKHTSAVQRGEEGVPKSIQLYLHIWLHAMLAAEYKAYGLKLIAYSLLFVSLLFSLEARPQSHGSRGAATGQITPLKIGDPIPDELWDLPLQVVNYPENKETITLSEYKDKLIILDFWATWCAPCIKSFPKLDSIQREYGEEIQILLVNSLRSTRDQKDQIDFLLKNRSNPAGERYIIPSIIDETVLKQAFPHKIMPHYVWIGQSGNIVGITGYDQFTRPDVYNLLNGGKITARSDERLLPVNPENRILSDRYDLDRIPKKMHGVITGHMERLPHSTGVIEEKGGYKKIYFLNQNLLSIIGKSISTRPIHHNRAFVDGIPLKSSPLQSHLIDTLYCYELTVDGSSSLDSLKLQVHNDISRFAGLKIELQDTSLDVWTVRLRDRTKIPVSTEKVSDSNLLDSGVGRKYTRNLSVGAFVNLLNQILPVPVVDGTEYVEKLDLDLPSDPRAISELNRALIQQGFEMVMQRRKIQVLNIKSNN